MKNTFVALTLPAALMLFAACDGGPTLEIPGLGGKMTEEEKIARILDDVHKAMQTRKVKRVMAHVSPAYLDQEGRDYEGIRAYLNNIMNNYRGIMIERSAPTVIVDGDRARAVEAFGTRATATSDQLAPMNLQGQVSVYLQREEGQWKIVEWGPIG